MIAKLSKSLSLSLCQGSTPGSSKMSRPNLRLRLESRNVWLIMESAPKWITLVTLVNTLIHYTISSSSRRLEKASEDVSDWWLQAALLSAQKSTTICKPLCVVRYSKVMGRQKVEQSPSSAGSMEPRQVCSLKSPYKMLYVVWNLVEIDRYSRNEIHLKRCRRIGKVSS